MISVEADPCSCCGRGLLHTSPHGATLTILWSLASLQRLSLHEPRHASVVVHASPRAAKPFRVRAHEYRQRHCCRTHLAYMSGAGLHGVSACACARHQQGEQATFLVGHHESAQLLCVLSLLVRIWNWLSWLADGKGGLLRRLRLPWSPSSYCPAPFGCLWRGRMSSTTFPSILRPSLSCPAHPRGIEAGRLKRCQAPCAGGMCKVPKCLPYR